MTRPDLDAIEQWAKPAADSEAFRDDVTACQRLLEIIAYARELEKDICELPMIERMSMAKQIQLIGYVQALERVLEPICRSIIDPLVTDAKRVLEDK